MQDRTPCPCCKSTSFWMKDCQHGDYEWICAICHPPPADECVLQWNQWDPPQDDTPIDPSTGIRPISAWGPECGRELIEDEPEWARKLEKPQDLRWQERIGRTSTPYPHILVDSGKKHHDGEPIWVSWLDYIFSIQPKPIDLPSSAIRLSAICGRTYVEIRKTKDNHYDLFVRAANSTQKPHRRTDFTTIFLAHAQRTAEAWFGFPKTGWKVEEAL